MAGGRRIRLVHGDFLPIPAGVSSMFRFCCVQPYLGGILGNMLRTAWGLSRVASMLKVTCEQCLRGKGWSS